MISGVKRQEFGDQLVSVNIPFLFLAKLWLLLLVFFPFFVLTEFTHFACYKGQVLFGFTLLQFYPEVTKFYSL